MSRKSLMAFIRPRMAFVVLWDPAEGRYRARRVPAREQERIVLEAPETTLYYSLRAACAEIARLSAQLRGGK
jgi:hypothetical protein